mgnify:CR=1 FL=1
MTSLVCAVSQEGAWAKQRAAWSKSIFRAPSVPAETVLTPRTRRGTEPPTVEPPPQERGGDRVHEALLFWFTHLAASSNS